MGQEPHWCLISHQHLCCRHPCITGPSSPLLAHGHIFLGINTPLHAQSIASERLTQRRGSIQTRCEVVVVSEGTPSWGPGLVSCAGLEASGMSPGLLLSQGSISVPQTRGNHAKAR